MEFKAAAVTIKFILQLSPISYSDYSQDSFTAYQNLFPWSRKTSNAHILKKSVFCLFQEYSLCLKSFIQKQNIQRCTGSELHILSKIRYFLYETFILKL